MFAHGATLWPPAGAGYSTRLRRIDVNQSASTLFHFILSFFCLILTGRSAQKPLKGNGFLRARHQKLLAPEAAGRGRFSTRAGGPARAAS